MGDIYTLTLCLRGNRTYVHGPDICAAISDYIVKYIGADEISMVDITCHRLASKNLVLEIFKNTNVPDKEHAIATAAFNKNKDRYVLLCRESDVEIDRRTDYAEEHMVRQCTVDVLKRQITGSVPSQFNVFQMVIAMTKALHHALFPSAPGKWIFTRLQTEFLVTTREQGADIMVVHEHNFNYKLTKNEVRMNNRRIGNIYFSLS